MSMVSTSSINVLINGDKTETFFPSKGIRQGDPLSPYIFILSMEFLSIKLSIGMQSGRWKGSQVSRRGPTLSHPFFADDLIFIEKATTKNYLYLKEILDFFCFRLGEKVNAAKSRIFFSKNIDQDTRNSLCSIIGYAETDSLGTWCSHLPKKPYQE
ncbi:hypothetical protein SLA2020_398710 [Shorea laevis]